MLKKIDVCLTKYINWLNRLLFRGYVDAVIDRCIRKQNALYTRVWLLTLQKAGKKNIVINYLQSQKQEIILQNVTSAMYWLDIGNLPSELMDHFILLEKKFERKASYAKILLAPLPIAICMLSAVGVKRFSFGFHLLFCLFAGYFIGTISTVFCVRIETYFKVKNLARWIDKQEACIVNLRVVK